MAAEALRHSVREAGISHPSLEPAALSSPSDMRMSGSRFSTIAAKAAKLVAKSVDVTPPRREHTQVKLRDLSAPGGATGPPEAEWRGSWGRQALLHLALSVRATTLQHWYRSRGRVI